jgi:hypothetical protein
MNGRLAKRLHKEARKRDREIFPELKEFINRQPFRDRVKIAIRILKGTF